MRNFADVQAQALEDHLCVGEQPACAQLGSGIMGLFEDHDARDEAGGELSQMQGGGESRRTSAKDDDIVVDHVLWQQSKDYPQILLISQKKTFLFLPQDDGG